MSKYNVLAITACISGVAHTYMAAERLEKLAKQENWSIKIETQGALGIENPITQDDVKESDFIIFISNVNIKNKEWFLPYRCIEMDISRFLVDPTPLIHNIKKIINAPKGTCIKL